MGQKRYLDSKSESRLGGCPGWRRRCREFEWRRESFVKERCNSEKRRSFSNIKRQSVGEEQAMLLSSRGYGPRVRSWWSVVRCPPRNASCVAPLSTRHVSHQGRASLPRAWGACVLDQSAQSSALDGRTSASAIGKLARLLGQVDWPWDGVLDVCIS